MCRGVNNDRRHEGHPFWLLDVCSWSSLRRHQRVGGMPRWDIQWNWYEFVHSVWSRFGLFCGRRWELCGLPQTVIHVRWLLHNSRDVHKLSGEQHLRWHQHDREVPPRYTEHGRQYRVHRVWRQCVQFGWFEFLHSLRCWELHMGRQPQEAKFVLHMPRWVGL